MAIRDFLYACVECGREGGIKPGRERETCVQCGTHYRRVAGSRIQVERPTGSTEVKHPADWFDLLEAQRPRSIVHTERRERVAIRLAHSSKPVRHRGIYLGQVEQFSAPETGWLTLTPNQLRFEPDGGPERIWPLDQLSAVQPSSTALQLKIRHGPVLSLRFLDASPLLWEERVRSAVQALYARNGQGEIREFQPRIVCR
jgi:hypothetical protein